MQTYFILSMEKHSNEVLCRTTFSLYGFDFYVTNQGEIKHPFCFFKKDVRFSHLFSGGFSVVHLNLMGASMSLFRRK